MAAAAATFFPPPRNNTIYNMTSSAGPSPPETNFAPQKGYVASPAQTPPNGISPPNAPNRPWPQLRQPRQPLYIPAALRPTESSRPKNIPDRPQAPDTPPTSNESSLDSNKSAPSPVMSKKPQLSRARTCSSRDSDHTGRGSSINTVEELEYNIGSVTGPPTTAHWKPDGLYNSCNVCLTHFSWYFRRHHCRRCGEVVCDADSRGTVPLDQNARYHMDGAQSRACNPCLAGWVEVRRLYVSRFDSLAEEEEVQGVPALAIPRPAQAQEEGRVGSMARSEGGMIWSTF